MYQRVVTEVIDPRVLEVSTTSERTQMFSDIP